MKREIVELKKLSSEDLKGLEKSVREEMLKEKANKSKAKAKEKAVKKTDLRKKLARIKTLINS